MSETLQQMLSEGWTVTLSEGEHEGERFVRAMGKRDGYLRISAFGSNAESAIARLVLMPRMQRQGV